MLEEDDFSFVAVVSFGSFRETVIAGDEWGTKMERMLVPEASAGSYEDVFHRTGLENEIIEFDRRVGVADRSEQDSIADPRGHRAIGIVYGPTYEGSNYVWTVVPDRYDGFVSVDESEALHPFGKERSETPPETYPCGV
ncbi:erythromycin esterase family protein [Natrinema halophilum]|uniref:Erythromycin esterase family protein n=1 Tax=Natrinema halophilum TaxID=1699371 RepID=A0A7D5GL44_9EURY|nr:erythromycin esterase family protein [Natrinema halophilum]QLG47473.1 erythromycin esterase family protein [Natrinema halophilum]